LLLASNEVGLLPEKNGVEKKAIKPSNHNEQARLIGMDGLFVKVCAIVSATLMPTTQQHKNIVFRAISSKTI